MIQPDPIWKLRPGPDQLPEFPDFGRPLPRLVRHLLAVRQLPGDIPIRQFLKPLLRDLSDPFELPGMGRAVPRILKAIDTGEEICIFGDYDVDGISSITLLQQVLEAYDAQVRGFIPQRGNEGYGLSQAAIERALEEGPKPSLMVTVDCGTASISEIAGLAERGIDVIVVDHHEPNPDGLPDCDAVVNPKLGSDLGYLCAAGVVFKLAHALLKTRPLPDFDLKEFIDLAAIATIADIVPLEGENRLIVRHGMRQLTRTRHQGLRALAEVAGLTLNQPPTGQEIGFRIGPRINAAGRMDQPGDALDLLLCADPSESLAIARELDGHNALRQKLEHDIRAQALNLLKNDPQMAALPVIVLGSRDWHPGVVGIVASRLMRRFHKPTFIISIDGQGMGKGSGRGIAGISLVDAIHTCAEYLEGGGGHDMAAGLNILEKQIPAFRQAFADYVDERLPAAERRPLLEIDAEVSFAELDLELFNSYELLHPFGNGNPQPLLMSRGVYPGEQPRELKNKHLKLVLHQDGITRDAIFFSGAENPLPEPPWDVAFTIDRNTFRGNTTLQIIVTAIRTAE